MCLSFCHHAFSFQLFLSLFLFVIFWNFSSLISWASSSSFPFCCRSVIPPLPQSLLASARYDLIFVVVLFSTLLCVSHYYSLAPLFCLFFTLKMMAGKWRLYFRKGIIFRPDFALTVLCWESEWVCLPYWHPVTKHTFSNMYTNLFSLYMCVSLFFWPMGVCVEWDVTGRLPCYTHKSNSIFFFFHRSDMMPQADHYTLQHFHRTVYVCGTQALVLDRPYMPPSNPPCTHTHIHTPQGEERLDKNWSALPNRTDRKETWD